MIRGVARVFFSVAFASSCGAAQAQNFGSGGLDAPTGGETFVFEPFVGYLRGTSTENVYDPTNKKNKISQLDWSANAVTVGGRVAFRPMDDLTVRGRFWTAVSADANMRDRDWLFQNGYQGANTWTHQSAHSNTKVPKAWQADISLAYTLIQAGDVSITGLAGYRHYEVGYKAYGGSYIYSGRAYRDSIGNFAPNELSISYQQKWDTPYIGIGAHYRGERFSLSTEIYGSPVSFSSDRDYHALRYTLFKDRFSPFGMVGANIGIEYQLTQMLSVAGRFDYTRYSEQKGGVHMVDYANGEYGRFPKPTAGAAAETMNLSLGIKAKL